MKILSLDIGGTKIKSALVEKDSVFQEREEPVDKDDLIHQIESIYKSYPENLPLALGMAGQIEEGFVASSPNLLLENVPLEKELAKRLKVQVKLLNDVQAAALAEAKYGRGKDCHRLAVVFLGTGIGAGLVINGALQTGSLGELGHTVISQEGLKCSCGRFGCLEPYAAGWGLAKQASTEDAKEVLQPGNKIAKIGFEALVTAFANLSNLLNPEKIILGGNLLIGYEHAFPDFLHLLEERIKKEVFVPNGQNLEVEKSAYPSTAVLIGAAAYLSAGLKL